MSESQHQDSSNRAGNRSLQIVVWAALAAVIAVIGFLFIKDGGFKRKAPYPVISTVQDFTLTNQLGELLTLSDLKGKVWVANIIFTQCPGPCAKLTQEMAVLQKTISGDVQFLTLTTDPDFDTPAVLKRYGERFKADPSNWFFATGSKKTIAQIAITDLKLTAVEKEESQRENENDLFIHSTNFIIVDKKGRVRASVEALEPFAQETLQKIIKDLQREPSR
jgi:protein SCO1/2